MTTIKKPMRVNHVVVANIEADGMSNFNPYAPMEPMPGVLPKNHSIMAMDSMPLAQSAANTWSAIPSYQIPQGIIFPGYGKLMFQSQAPLNRAIVETLADEMVRKFIELISTSEDDTETVRKNIMEATEAYKMKHWFREAAAKSGYMGGCLLYIDMGDDTETARGRRELKSPLIVDKSKIAKGSFKGFKLIEPIHCYPGIYNASQPLSKNFYIPEFWYIMGLQVHSSRFLHFLINEPPVLMKPGYNFFGISITQLVSDYIEKFDNSRTAAVDLVDKFSVIALKTNLSNILSEEVGSGVQAATSLVNRLKLFQALRHNRRIMAIDKDTEELEQLATPLSGLADIVSKNLEFLTCVARMPQTKFLGISPGGFNATGESDTRNWYDRTHSEQERMFLDNIAKAINIIQLSTFGRIVSGIKPKFVSLQETSETEKLTNRKTESEVDQAYIDMGVISPEEVRKRLANDPESGYGNIDADTMPEPIDNEEPDDNDPQEAQEDDDLIATGEWDNADIAPEDEPETED